MKEYFPSIPHVKYEGKSSANPMAFRFYNLMKSFSVNP